MTDETLIEEEIPEETSESVKARKDLLIFWIRMISWVLVTVGAPVTTFAINFGLFTEYGYQITTDELGNVTGMNIALNGWGIVSVLLVVFAATTILGEVIDAYSKKYSYSKQILVGIKEKVMPLAIAIGVCVCVRNCLDQVIFCLATVGICQIAGIFLNPLPKWKAEKKNEENYDDLLSGFMGLIKDYKAKKKGGK